jgi:hypothetical protein
MPISTSVITGTVAHKHSSPSSDGGFLDDTVTGMTGTSNGSLVYFNGASVAQNLGIGSANTVLTSSGGIPAWSASTSNPLIQVSKDYTDIAGGSVDVYTLPQDAALVNVWTDITTVFSNSTGVTIGDAGDDDGFAQATNWTSGTGLTDATRGAYVTTFKTMRSTTGSTAIKAYNFAMGNVSSGSFVGSLNVSAQNSSPGGLCFNTTGSKMYVAGFNSPYEVNEYDLSTPYDLSTASFLQRFATTGRPGGVTFNDTGSKMYTTDLTGSNGIEEYAVSTPFDISTASYTTNFSVSAQEGQPCGVRFNTTGSKMYVIGQLSNAIFEYDVSTPFDISTASYSGSSLSVVAQENGARDLAFNSTGTIVCICGLQNDTVYQYDLTSAFDVSTGSYSGNSFSVAAQDSDPMGIDFNGDDTKMFIAGEQNASIYEYTISLGALDTQGDVDFYLQVVD